MKIESTLLKSLRFIKKRLNERSNDADCSVKYTTKLGWMQHLFDKHRRTDVDFPVVTYRPDDNDSDLAPAADAMTDVVTIAIEGAVRITDYPHRRSSDHYELSDEDDPVMVDLIRMRHECLVALAVDNESYGIPFRDLKFSKCVFDLPEAGEPFAFFTQLIQLNLTETLC